MGEKKKVAILDDDPDYADILAEFFQGAGFDTTYINTLGMKLEEAISKVNECTPDGVVSDKQWHPRDTKNMLGAYCVMKIQGVYPAILMSMDEHPPNWFNGAFVCKKEGCEAVVLKLMTMMP